MLFRRDTIRFMKAEATSVIAQIIIARLFTGFRLIGSGPSTTG